MNKTSIYNEIRQSINSGNIASLPKETLEQYSIALARAQAYTHFGASEFPRVCETVKTLLMIHSLKDSTAKIPCQATKPPTDITDEKSNWHEKPLGKLFYQILGGLVLAGIIYLIAKHFGIHL